MKDLNIKSKLIRISFLTLAIFALNSCKDEPKNIEIEEETVEVQKPLTSEALLVGSWKDTSPSALHFSIFEDGTAKSDNMKTLLYKSWSVKDNKITFIVESIGNKTTTTDTIVQTIEKLTNNELILVDGDIREAYKKAKN
ncbi:lipocalin family protein [Flavobacterium ardleyense]|uniref:Lipocalin family protein n=1 Tax=Flavobacterium ardleyense TaxID=2038737 RepID=A0ABW5ZBW6_9FLAO